MNKRIKGIYWTILAFILIFAFYLFWYFHTKDTVLVLDEWAHFPQIMRFAKSDFTLSESLAMGPGYHLFISFFVRVLNIKDIQAVRLLNLILNFASLSVFYLTAKKINAKEAGIKLLLFAFIPINALYFLFMYTDMFSTCMVVLSLYLVLSKRYFLAGIVGICSLIVRQSNIFWLGFLFTLIYYTDNGIKWEPKRIIKHLAKTYLFIFGFIGFGIYFLYNPTLIVGKGVVNYGNYKFSLNNIYFLLFLHFYLFLPENIAAIVKIIEFVKKRLRYCLLGIGVLYPIFLFSFNNSHVWNITGNFLRNVIMIIFTTNVRSKTIFFLVMVFSILIMIVTKFHRKEYYLVYLFSIFSLMWIWMVEPRYYMVFYAFFILFRKIESAKITLLTVLFHMIASSYLIYGTYNFLFYP